MKYILRIYDEGLDRKLKELYEAKKSQYSSMNAFLTELVKTGLESPVSHSDNSEIENLLREALDTLIKGFERQLKDHDIFTKLLSAMYALALAKNEEGYISKSLVEKGVYDDLPARFGDKNE